MTRTKQTARKQVPNSYRRRLINNKIARKSPAILVRLIDLVNIQRGHNIDQSSSSEDQSQNQQQIIQHRPTNDQIVKISYNPDQGELIVSQICLNFADIIVTIKTATITDQSMSDQLKAIYQNISVLFKQCFNQLDKFCIEDDKIIIKSLNKRKSNGHSKVQNNLLEDVGIQMIQDQLDSSQSMRIIVDELLKTITCLSNKLEQSKKQINNLKNGNNINDNNNNNDEEDEDEDEQS